MAFPANWPPPRTPQGNGALRFFVEGVATADFADNAWLFSASGSPIQQPTPIVPPGGGVSTGLPPTVVPAFMGSGAAWCMFIRVVNLGTTEGDLEISFDGATPHGVIWNANSAANNTLGYQTTNEYTYERCEAGISVRGVNGTAAVPFRIEAW